jgi:transposase-like protein
MNFFEFQKQFPNEKSVIAHFITIRYNNEPACHHCGSVAVYHRQDFAKKFQCMDCNNTFSVFKDTIFENSSTDMVKWMYAIHLFLNGKKGISGLQLMREVGVTYKTAWRMLKQIRSAMGNEYMAGFFETIVEIDETYVGGKPRKENKGREDKGNKRGRGTGKTPVVGVIDRDNKKVHAKVALPNKEGKKLTGRQLMSVLTEVAKAGATVMSDEFRSYNIVSKNGFIHLKVDHTKEFAKGAIHTNSIESFWATLKRGVYGVYHSISAKYLQNYVDEFSFRYNNRGNKGTFDLLLKNAILVG